MATMSDPTCHAQDAKDAEHGLKNGALSQPSEQNNSLPHAIKELVRAIDEQNELLIQIVAQNADLIGTITSQDDEDEPTHDLSGRRLI